MAASLKLSVPHDFQSHALEILSRAGRRARWSRTCGASAQVPDSPSSSLRNAAVENRAKTPSLTLYVLNHVCSAISLLLVEPDFQIANRFQHLRPSQAFKHSKLQ